MAHAQHAPQCSNTRCEHDYQRRRPEQTALYQIIQAYWPEFAERADALGGLPHFIIKEFEAFLDCGVLERGFVSVKCPSCGFERLVGFSCKTRGFCPTCVGRRMNDAAAHLVDRVLPLNAIRQWVCTMPYSLRYAMGYDKSLCADILSGYAAQLMRWYKQRGKRPGYTGSLGVETSRGVLTARVQIGGGVVGGWG